MFVCDAKGDCAGSLPLRAAAVNNADRPEFIAHRDSPSREPLIGPPTRSRVDGSWVISLTRRIDDRDGRFAGIVVAVISSAFFSDYYSQFDARPNGSINLLTEDGRLIAREPAIEQYIGESFGHPPADELNGSRVAPLFREYRARIGNVTRMSASRRLADFPLVIVVARARDEVLATWRATAWTDLAGGTVIIAIVLLFGSDLSRQIRARAKAGAQLQAALDDNQRALARLAQSEAMFRHLYDATPVMMHSLDAKGALTNVSATWLKRLGYRREEVIGRKSLDLFYSPASRQHAIDVVIPQFKRDGVLVDVEFQFITKSGEVVDVELSANIERDAKGAIERILVVSKDVSLQKRLANALAAEQERLAVTLTAIADGVVTTDHHGNITYLNPVAQSVVGWTSAEAEGMKFADVVRLSNPIQGGVQLDPVQRTLARQQVTGLPTTTILTDRDGVQYGVHDSVAPIFARDGSIIGTVMVFQSVTEARGVAQKMSYLAHYDSLTGLPNRVLFQDRVHQACSSARRFKRQFAVIFMDLDRFKHVNDSLGHAAGDELLKVVANRLTGALRASDTVCRLGGDEFVMLLSDIRQSADVAAVASKILAAISVPIVVKGTEICIGISLGIAVFPDDGDNLETLMKHADGAMYRSKFDGRNRSTFFSKDMEEAPAARLQVEADMRRGLANGEFIVHYQPIVDARSRHVVAVEALVRWGRPGNRLEPPANFIPIAEESGLIVPMGATVLHQVCEQLRRWSSTALRDVTAAVNISPLQLADAEFVEMVADALRSTGADGAQLEFEITETTLMRDPDAALAIINRLKALGVRIAIDDFGTGYSSLSYLKRFPVDTVKIDRSFVRDLESDASDQELVRAIVAMCRSLKLHIVAEGVETEAQAAILSAMACPTFQGYLFAKPNSAAVTESWLLKRLDRNQDLSALVA
jgi:diguanylate cyclase (GGDEF)-like protein/PAS domain S-box-containing protein